MRRLVLLALTALCAAATYAVVHSLTTVHLSRPDPAAVWVAAPSPTATSSPDVPVAMTWAVPDDRLTPGATVPGCTYPRPAADRNVSTTTKHRAALAYHYTGRAGITYVEYDHRIPYALCGADTLPNIWPEPVEPGFTQSGFSHNRKDELETVLASKVRYHHMTLKAAQMVFAGDWRAGWCRFVDRPAGLC